MEALPLEPAGMDLALAAGVLHHAGASGAHPVEMRATRCGDLVVLTRRFIEAPSTARPWSPSARRSRKAGTVLSGLASARIPPPVRAGGAAGGAGGSRSTAGREIARDLVEIALGPPHGGSRS
jgi:hypothetical protein